MILSGNLIEKKVIPPEVKEMAGEKPDSDGKERSVCAGRRICMSANTSVHTSRIHLHHHAFICMCPEQIAPFKRKQTQHNLIMLAYLSTWMWFFFFRVLCADSVCFYTSDHNSSSVFKSRRTQVGCLKAVRTCGWIARFICAPLSILRQNLILYKKEATCFE